MARAASGGDEIFFGDGAQGGGALGPLRPLRGSRVALGQPDAFGAGELPARTTERGASDARRYRRHGNARVAGYTKGGRRRDGG